MYDFGRFIQGCKGKEDAYLFYHWQLIDTFIYFSHQFVTIPPAGWILAAHRHGVDILGKLQTFFEYGKGSQFYTFGPLPPPPPPPSTSRVMTFHLRGKNDRKTGGSYRHKDSDRHKMNQLKKKKTKKTKTNWSKMHAQYPLIPLYQLLW